MKSGDPDNLTAVEPAAGEAHDAGPRPTVALSDAALKAGGSCVQCGLCLPACPTYLETGNEADGPRGRIRIMLGLHDGDVPHTPAGQEHLDRCLGCLACASVCPSGVDYGRLLDETRDKLAGDRVDGAPPAPPLTRLQRAIFFGLLARPERLRVGLAAARVADRLGLRNLARRTGLLRLMGPTVRRMDAMLPADADAPVWTRSLPSHSRAGGMDMVVKMLDPARIGRDEEEPRTVAFFEGCVAAVMAADVHRKAAELICAAGADVISPPDQVCCGAIHRHGGAADVARDLARRNIDVYLPEGAPQLDAIVTCTAGDGAMLRGYGGLLADDPCYAERAKRFASLVRDVTELFVELDLPANVELNHDVTLTAAYHDACHLAHAQGVTTPPRALLARVPGLTLVDLPESDVCCGAAGTYNLTQPEMAARLADRKLDRFEQTGADVLVSGNVGCTMHLRSRAAERGVELRVMHPVELLHAAAFGGS